MMMTFRVVAMSSPLAVPGYKLSGLPFGCRPTLVGCKQGWQLFQIAYFVIGSGRPFRQGLRFAVDPDRPHPDGVRARHVDVRPVAHEHGLGRSQTQAVERFLEYTRSGLSPSDGVGDQDLVEEV